VLSSSDDPFCGIDQAQRFASSWGSTLINVGARGHINADSGLGDWPEAHAELQQLMALLQADKLAGSQI
jgi:predicted alpha/beta hydrolase family esterase